MALPGGDRQMHQTYLRTLRLMSRLLVSWELVCNVCSHPTGEAWWRPATQACCEKLQCTAGSWCRDTAVDVTAGSSRDGMA